MVHRLYDGPASRLQTKTALERIRGGLLLMRAFMDEVRYNPVGNRVALVKRRDECPQPIEALA